MRGPPIRAGKRDASERPIIEALKAHGCLVAQLDKFDLAVQTPAGWVVLMECKSGRGRITDSQQEMLDAGWKLHIVRTPEEAIAVVREG